MAEKRMFARAIVSSDAFMDLPFSTQLLYFHFGMQADDDGFINSPNKIMRMVGAEIDDIERLISNNFLIKFDNGALVIRHWNIHNYVAPDRYSPTTHQEELSLLKIDKSRSYSLVNESCIQEVRNTNTDCIQDVYGLKSKKRIDKKRTEKNSKDERLSNRFIPPSVEEIAEYLSQKEITSFTAEQFFDWYEGCGWVIGNNKPMLNWKAVARNWQRKNDKQNNQGKDSKPDPVETNWRGDVLQ